MQKRKATRTSKAIWDPSWFFNLYKHKPRIMPSIGNTKWMNLWEKKEGEGRLTFFIWICVMGCLNSGQRAWKHYQDIFRSRLTVRHTRTPLFMSQAQGQIPPRPRRRRFLRKARICVTVSFKETGVNMFRVYS